MTRRPGPHDVANWNTRHPVGTPVRYWPWLKMGPGVESKTTQPARILCPDGAFPGVAAVWVEGRPDAIALTHVEPVTADTAVQA